MENYPGNILTDVRQGMSQKIAVEGDNILLRDALVFWLGGQAYC